MRAHYGRRSGQQHNHVAGPLCCREIIRINTVARHTVLQVALLVPILAGLIGLFNSFRMPRLPDPKPSSGADAMALG